MVKNKIMTKTFQSMEELKRNHSKVKNIEYESMSMQKYLKPNRCEMSLADAKMQNDKC